MILKAEEARDQNKVKNILDCLATENSWRLSENFERSCIERNQINIEDQIDFSAEMKSSGGEDSCLACFNHVNNNNTSMVKSSKKDAL